MMYTKGGNIFVLIQLSTIIGIVGSNFIKTSAHITVLIFRYSQKMYESNVDHVH